jgi:hypothetical protein
MLTMIDAKSFVQFVEQELDVKFVEVDTGTPLLDAIIEREANKRNPYADPNYKSDYDRFLADEGELE